MVFADQAVATKQVQWVEEIANGRFGGLFATSNSGAHDRIENDYTLHLISLASFDQSPRSLRANTLNVPTYADTHEPTGLRMSY